MIAQSTIDEVMAKIDIVDVIKEFLTLKKRGANYIGLSPFANERTPSFTVSPAKDIFKCFSSGQGGNAIKFLILHDSMTYPEAIRWLAKHYKVDFIEEGTKEQADERLVHEAIYICNDFAVRQFQENLNNEPKGWDYLKTRCLSKEIIEEFQIGYAIDAPDHLTNQALKNHLSLERMMAADLTVERNNQHYDKFRNRIVFPIHTISGKVAGFTARVIDPDDKMAKYINTSENAVFKKGSLLYGIHIAKKHIKKGEGAYVVEGQMDVVSVHAGGVRNVVASSGTAFTKDHIRMIQRFTDTIVFLYDGDAAGFRAAAKGIELAIEEGMHVRVVVFPPGEDPDSFITNYGADDFKLFVEANKKDIVDFFFRDMDKLTPEEMDAAKRQLLTIIAKIDKQDSFRIKAYVDKLALKYQIDTGSIYSFINGQRNKNPKTLDEAIAPTAERCTKYPHELEFCRLLVKYGNLPRYGDLCIYTRFAEEMAKFKGEFSEPLAQNIIDAYEEFLSRDVIPSLDDFLKLPDPEISAFVTNIAFNQFEISANWEGFEYITGEDHEKDITNGLANYRMHKLSEKINKNIAQLKQVTEEEAINKLLTSNKKLQDLRLVEANKLGISIIK